MTLTITGTTITSDQNPHTAQQAPSRPHQWEVSWLPGQAMDRNTAITAMLLADTACQGDLHEGHRLWPHIQSWAAELGLTGPDAIARASQPPRGLDPGQERASGQPDREAGQLTSQSDTTSRSPGRAHLEVTAQASQDEPYAGTTRADPQPAGAANAMADSAHQLPPGISAEQRAALTGPQPEPEADEWDEPEPGTGEWAYQTGNYIDPEPDWDAGPPYVDHAHGEVYWDTASEADAGRERYPSYRHFGPEPGTEAETAEVDGGRERSPRYLHVSPEPGTEAETAWDDPDPWGLLDPEAEP
jgi:hypothetical protein